VQINLHGATEIVDLDGETLSERAAARKWGILFTPTMILLPPEVSLETPAATQAVAVMPGYFSAGTTLDLLTWVAEDRYLDQSEEDFQRYHARMIRERADGDTR
jgi:thioredoxin-related protein